MKLVPIAGGLVAATLLAAAGPADAAFGVPFNGTNCVPGGTTARPCVLATQAGSGTGQFPDPFELELDLFASAPAVIDAKGGILQKVKGTGTVSPYEKGVVGPPAILLAFTGQFDVAPGSSVARFSASTDRGDLVVFTSSKFDFGSTTMRELVVDYQLTGPATVGPDGFLAPAEFTTAEGSFTTDVAPARFPVPVPPAAPAVGAGLFGLAALTRRHRRATPRPAA